MADNIFSQMMQGGKQVGNYFSGVMHSAHTEEEKATENAISSGANPSDLVAARQSLGRKDYIGYCEGFVEKATGSGWQGKDAVSAWANQKVAVQGGTGGIQPGDILYFSANQGNGFNGHTGIYAGDNQFISSTDNGVEQRDINDWTKATGQQVLGYVPHMSLEQKGQTNAEQ